MDQQGHRVVVEQAANHRARKGEVFIQKGPCGEQQQLIPLLGALLRAAHPDQGRRPGTIRHVQFIPGGTVRHLVRANPSVQQAGVEQLPEYGQALLVPAAEGLHVPALHALLVQLLPQAGEYLPHLRGVDGLHDVLRNPHAHRLPGVLKVVKAGEHHQLGRRQGLAQPAAQLQAVHKGHLDVGQDHVGLELLGELQGLRPVLRLSHQGKAQAGPINFPADSGADLLLVVSQQHTVGLHGSSPFVFSQYTTSRLPLGI